MSGSFRIYLAGALAGTVLTGQVAAADCMGQRAVEADQIRFVQSAMMVAALQCKRQPGIKARYNNFVTNNKAQLQQSYNTLERWLGSVRGQDIGKHLTSQANRISAKTWRARSFCQTMFEIGGDASGGLSLLSYVDKLPVQYEPATYGSSCSARVLTAQKQSED